MITANIASHLPEIAKQQPKTWAVVEQSLKKQTSATYEKAYTYQQLDEVSNLVANGLENFGISKGTRVVLMVKPGLDFFALVFALFKLEAVLVAVDPGMGIKNLGECLAEAEPEAFIGISTAHIARSIFNWGDKTINKVILVGNNPILNRFITDLDKIKTLGKSTNRKPGNTKAEDVAAILFTSGSTGVPKGVIYKHANFTAQVEAIKSLYSIQPGEIDLATFPLFALFAPALGITSIIPKMDFTKPGSVNPQRIVDAINQYKCTTMFGSPALLNRVGRWAENKTISLKSLKRVLSAGAPVSPEILSRYKKLLNKHIEIYTPYGATEALPVSSIGSNEVILDTAKQTQAGKGICVGQPVPNIDMKIIKISDEVISEWDDSLELPENEIGEICVKGPQVTRAYYNRNEATGLAKIRTKDGFYHRMGDLAYRDKIGRIWFCGRKSHRVVTSDGTLFTDCCEGVFNSHPFIFRTALVGIKQNSKTVPVICIELEAENKRFNKKELVDELRVLASNNEITKNIEYFLFHPGFPVDIRHNAKIGREKLSVWAQDEIS